MLDGFPCVGYQNYCCRFVLIMLIIIHNKFMAPNPLDNQNKVQGVACAKDEIHDKYIQKCNMKGTDMKGHGIVLVFIQRISHGSPRAKLHGGNMTKDKCLPFSFRVLLREPFTRMKTVFDVPYSPPPPLSLLERTHSFTV